MIRIILVALTVVLFLIFNMPTLMILGTREKRNPGQIQVRSLRTVQGVSCFVLKLAGVIYEVRGLESIPRSRAVLYVGSHRDYFDTLIGHVTISGPTGFVAKKEMLKALFLRGWMHRMSCLLLGWTDIEEGLETIPEDIDKVKSGISVWISPEGTRNENEDMTELLPFHEGSLEITRKDGCPVIPVAVTGTASIFEQHLPLIRPSYMVIRYGESIYIKELPPESRRFPGSHTRDIISDMLREMNQVQGLGGKEA